MRVALVHSFYRSESPSGENVVVMRQVEALRSAGHEVLVVARHTDDELKKRLHGLKSAVRVATGQGPDPSAELKAFGPDVVHAHNLFPNFGERWLSRWDGPLVATVHNFRPVCANGLLYRDGDTCTLCVGGNPWPAVRHACYRGSRAATLPLALHNVGGAKRNRLLTHAARVIALSERSRAILIEADPSLAARIVVIPNGLPDRSRPEHTARSHWSFVGRLSEEKGIAELIESWPSREPLFVVGDGPLRAQLEASAGPEVRFLGSLGQDGVDEVLRSSLGLVFPSRWAEGFPTVVAEAFMHGTPVVARRGNSGADYVARTKAGVVYNDNILSALEEVRVASGEWSTKARTVYVDHLTVESWTRTLLGLYRAATRPLDREPMGRGDEQA